MIWNLPQMRVWLVECFEWQIVVMDGRSLKASWLDDRTQTTLLMVVRYPDHPNCSECLSLPCQSAVNQISGKGPDSLLFPPDHIGSKVLGFASFQFSTASDNSYHLWTLVDDSKYRTLPRKQKSTTVAQIQVIVFAQAVSDLISTA